MYKYQIKNIGSILKRLSLLMIGFISCNNSDSEDLKPVSEPFLLAEYSEPVQYSGIAIYTADMAKNKVTEVNSEWVIRKSSGVRINSEILRNKYNAIHKISFESFNDTDDYIEFVVALHGKLINKVAVPNEMLQNTIGIKFKAVSFDKPLLLTVEALDVNEQIIKSQNFTLTNNQIEDFELIFNTLNLHHIAFRIDGSLQKLEDFRNGGFSIDDIYLTNSDNSTFFPPQNDSELLAWLKETSIRYFLWNYRDMGDGRGIVLESNENDNRVSISGLGYAYAIFILAENENLISSIDARNKIISILRWQQNQDWFGGDQGIYGFPLHYYDPNGNGVYKDSPQAVSTIDWAINAAGIRTVKQKYISDSEVVSLCDELLNRADWSETIHNNQNDSYRYGRISKGLSIVTGEKNGQVWADAFSEETEIIYLEALASGKVPDLDLSRIYRENISGFYASWFGAGFTYNWLQLWTGPIEPYLTNSISAYQYDYIASNSSFGLPLMGLTACNTVLDNDENGFVNWKKYISNQGSFVSGAPANEVIQISPAPYGCVLALPFQNALAIESLRNYLDVGYFHPLLGLPDNIRVSDLPQGVNVPIPNWSTFDINIGPIAMAIEQTQNNSIKSFYLSDLAIDNSLNNLIASFINK